MEKSNVTPLVPKDKNIDESLQASLVSSPITEGNSFRIRSVRGRTKQSKKSCGCCIKKSGGEDKHLKVK